MKGAAAILAMGATATCMVSGLSLPHRDASQPLQQRSPGTPLKVPIYHHSRRDMTDPEQTRKFASSQYDRVRAKWGNHQIKREARESLAKRQIIGLSDVGADSFYVGQVGVGTPVQNFNVILDTGSSDFWLADTSCTATGCATLDQFDSAASSTYQASSTQFSIQYGSGAAQGDLATDTVSLAGYTVNSQTFAVVDQLAQGTLDQPASGIMGLGFEQLASSGATPFWQVLAEGNTFQQKVFTFQLARDPNAQSTSTVAPGGIFTLGQLDSAQYSGTVNYIDLSGTEGYWTIPMQAYSVNGASTSLSTGNTAAIDTGTSLIIAPPDVAAAIYQQIPNARTYGDSSQGSSGTYAIPCTSDVTITLSFGGQVYSVNSQDMLNGALDSTGQYCLGGVLGVSLGSGAPDYIVGDTFLKNVFSVFQYSPAAVGFASLVGNGAQTAATAGGSTSQQTTAASSPASTVSASIPTVATSSLATSASSRVSVSTPVAGSGLSAPVAVTTVATSSPSITPAGQSGSSGSNAAQSSNPLPLLALCSAVLVGFFAVVL